MEHLSERPRRITRKELLRLGALGVLGGILLGCSAPPSRSETVIAQESHEVNREINLLEKQWTYLPGSQREAAGLRIQANDFAIVEQDGSGGQENPPVNLFGTRLAVKGGFALQAQLLRPASVSASLQFYGEVPLVADDFRLERKSIRVTAAKDSITVNMWDGSRQEPVDSRTFDFPAQGRLALRMERLKGKLAFTANGQKLGEMDERGVFSAGQLWFGANSTSGSWFLSELQAEELAGGELQFVDTATLKVERDPQGLQTLARAKRSGFTIGAAMALAPMVSDNDYARAALAGNFGSITTENALKWQFVHPKPDVYDFHEADALVALAERHAMAVHGHALIFGEANPRWVQDLPANKVETTMIDHLRTTAAHFKGRVASWDVINEPLMPYEEAERRGITGLRNHIWYRAMGESYIVKAMAAMHNTDSDALLCINEYGLEADDERWDAFMALMKRLKPQLEAAGVPREKVCVGFQGHVYEPADRIDPEVLQRHMQALGELGFKVRVSEMDVYGSSGAGVQARQYASVFKACFEESNCVGWTAWILSDKYNYYKDNNVIKRGVDGLFGTDMHPRTALNSIREVLEN
ncbi:MAG: endo-1,4-beta-xylanase [Candidatus Saccharimonadales bacterium]